MDSGAAQGRPAITTAERMVDVILALSGTSERPAGGAGIQGAGEAHRAQAGRTWPRAARSAGSPTADTQARPVPVITSPVVKARPVGAATRLHGQHRGAQTVPHPHRAHALLCRPRLVGGTRRRCHLPAPRTWRGCSANPLGRDGIGPDRAIPHPAFQVVDPLGIPGQPVHVVAVPRWSDHVDEPTGCGEDRSERQRLDRGGEPQRRAGGRAVVATACPRAWCTSTTHRNGPSTYR